MKNKILFLLFTSLLIMSNVVGQDQFGKVAISEVYFDTYVVEKQGFANHHAGEFIELYNSSRS